MKQTPRRNLSAESRAGPRQEVHSPIRGRGIHRATSVSADHGPGQTHMRAKRTTGPNGLWARDAHSIRHAAPPGVRTLFLARPYPAAGVKTRMEQIRNPLNSWIKSVDRVGVTGLRPSPLPHHRTCGFLASGGWRRWTSPGCVHDVCGCARRHSVLSFTTFRLIPPRRLRSVPQPESTGRLPCRGRPLTTFQATRDGYRVRLPACLLRLQPFAPAAFTAFVATMASADFCPSLNRQISPGKVHGLSGRAVGLYPARLSVTVGFRGS